MDHSLPSQHPSEHWVMIQRPQLFLFLIQMSFYKRTSDFSVSYLGNLCLMLPVLIGFFFFFGSKLGTGHSCIQQVFKILTMFKELVL